MIRAIAVDDEPIALKVVEEHASKIPFLELEECFTDAFEALDFLQQNKVDLVFLDINMPDISGLDFLKVAKKNFQIIFTTAYSEYAVESYEHNAADYLLKPFEFGRFLKAVMKVKDNLKQEIEDYFFVKSGYEYLRINFNDLLFIKGEGNYLKLVEKDRNTLTRMTFEEVLGLLPENHIQVHRSFIINSQLVEKLEKHQVIIGNHQVPVNSEGFEKLKSLVFK